MSALWQASKAAMPKGPSHKEEALIAPARRPGFWRSGDPLVWMSAGALAVSLLMVLGLVLLVALRGAAYFWPAPVLRLELADGSTVIGEQVARERAPAATPSSGARHRIQLKVGNRDVYGMDFLWVDEDQIALRETPREIAVLERLQGGDAYGIPVRLESAQGTVHGEGMWQRFQELHAQVVRLRNEIRRLERDRVGAINHRIEAARLALVRLGRSGAKDPRRAAEAARQEEIIAQAEREYQEVLQEIRSLRSQLGKGVLVLALADGRELEVPVSEIVRVYFPNAMNLMQKLGWYASKLWEFVSQEPRESNTEGGIFPAIFGTVLMVLLMTVAVVPAGVLAAVYLTEYAKEGWVTSVLRVCIRSLAGVPSIVFGAFGVGFFIYFVGGRVDRLFFPEKLPAPTFGTGGILWASLTLALLTLPVVIVATEEGLASVPNSVREASYALGATKFETVWKVAVPGALPGIMTGVILGIARAAGEVAPLMMTGVVKLAPELPVDGHPPFLHLERKLMHLGYFIYDLGFQSPNVEAAQPMLFATALALMVIVFALNFAGIRLRSRIRSRAADRV